MKSPGRALQAAIFRALVDDARLGQLVDDRIFDGRPAPDLDGYLPCVTFGDNQSLEDDEECIDGHEEFFVIDCWADDQGRRGPCKDIAWAVRDALHDRDDLALPDPWALHSIRVTETRVQLDPDGIKAHGIITVRALVETAYA